MSSFIPPNASPASADFVNSPLWNGHLEQAMEQAKAIITRETADMEEGPESYGWLLATAQLMLREWAKDRATANILRQQSRHQDEEIRRQEGEITRLEDDGFEMYEAARDAVKQWEEYANQCHEATKEEGEKVRKALEQKTSARRMCRELEKRSQQFEEEIRRLREAMKDNEGLWDASLEVSRTGLKLSRKALGQALGQALGEDDCEDDGGYGGENEGEDPRKASGDAL